MRPGRAIGARAALALGQLHTPPADPDLLLRVQHARVRRARALVPIDALAAPTGAEWALSAALHDVLQCASPRFNGALRRSAAARILELAGETIDFVGPPANVGEALSRHAWLARVLDIARTDTAVSWWTGSRDFLGVEPPGRLQVWPHLRRVSVVRTPRPLLELTPLAVDRQRLVEVIARLLARTPLTELATCTRVTPPFEWSEATLALVGTHAGRTLALRALARLPAADVDAALGRATRNAVTRRPAFARAAARLLADRAVAGVEGHVASASPASLGAEASFARGFGAAAASRALASPDSSWNEAERRKLLRALEPAAREMREVLAALESR
jgi:hypothetical protein